MRVIALLLLTLALAGCEGNPLEALGWQYDLKGAPEQQSLNIPPPPAVTPPQK
jgi:hypothetical protein